MWSVSSIAAKPKDADDQTDALNGAPSINQKQVVSQPNAQAKDALKANAAVSQNDGVYPNPKSTFEERAQYLLMTLESWFKEDPKKCNEFVKTLDSSFTSYIVFNQLSTQDKQNKFKQAMLGGAHPILESPTDMEELLNRYAQDQKFTTFNPLDFYKTYSKVRGADQATKDKQSFEVMEDAKQCILKAYAAEMKDLEEEMQPLMEEVRPLQKEMTDLRNKTRADLLKIGLKEREVDRLMKAAG